MCLLWTRLHKYVTELSLRSATYLYREYVLRYRGIKRSPLCFLLWMHIPGTYIINIWKGMFYYFNTRGLPRMFLSIQLLQAAHTFPQEQ